MTYKLTITMKENASGKVVLQRTKISTDKNKLEKMKKKIILRDCIQTYHTIEANIEEVK